jgi:3-deoxy-manno-octulosonate cytidylyltransferase (CMP-KDO synthetase)
MVVRVAERTRAAKRIDRVVVATDDQRIIDVVEAAGHEAIMTPSDCASGTDRVAYAARDLNPALVINVQGDEPLIDPDDLDVLVAAMKIAVAPMGTLARPLPSPDAPVVRVVTALNGDALYFSRSPLKEGLMHVGIYAYMPRTLQKLATLPRTPLEIAESLEQLRALENGMAIHVARCVSAMPTQAVDTPEDIEKVLQILRGTN